MRPPAVTHACRKDTLVLLLKELAQRLPGVLLTKGHELIEGVLDPDAPAWRRAMMLTLLLEIVAISGVELPVGILLRFTLLHTALLAGDQRRHECCRVDRRC